MQKKIKKMYRKVNKLKYYLKVVEITNKHYVEGVSTYSGIFRKYIEPIYPMSYQQYIKIINMPNLKKQLEKELTKRGDN